MEKIITYEKIDLFAYTNKDSVKKPVRGIVVEFAGLGCTWMIKEEPARAAMLAENGILYVFPYNNPWNWMNPQAVAYTDEVLDALRGGLGLPESLPVVSIGGSMGGQCALVYACRAARTPVACVANCPVCDIPYHFTERPDLPRTLYSALSASDAPLQEALRGISPLHLVDELPDIPYHIFHCGADRAVNLDKHSARFVEAMKKGHRVTFHVVPDRDHCDLTPEAWAQFDRYILDAVAGA